MYKVVAPILYEEPIVQNIGLFFLGIEQPSQDQNESDDQANTISHSEIENRSETGTEGSIPYHKRHLLDLVKKLNIIRASSSTPLYRCYIEHPTTSFLLLAADKHLIKCDPLATAEIEGWTLAKSLLNRLAEQSDTKLSWKSASPLILMQRLTALTFGLWDDGRWAFYQNKAKTREEHDAELRLWRRGKQIRGSFDSEREDYYTYENDISASAYLACEDILSPFFLPTVAHQALSLCHHTNFGHRIFERQYLDSRPSRVEGLRVIHEYQETDYNIITNAGPSRMFTRYSQDGMYDRFPAERMHRIHMATFHGAISVYSRCLPDRLPDHFHADTNLRLDFCVLLDNPDTRPQKAQIRTDIEAQQCSMDQLIKKDQEESDALEGGSTVKGGWREQREALLLRMVPYDIYIGDDVPPCPGCGLKEKL